MAEREQLAKLQEQLVANRGAGVATQLARRTRGQGLTCQGTQAVSSACPTRQSFSDLKELPRMAARTPRDTDEVKGERRSWP
jgi:hypothetical protein